MMHKERAWENDPRQLSSQRQAHFKLVFLVCILRAASKFDTLMRSAVAVPVLFRTSTYKWSFCQMKMSQLSMGTILQTSF